MARHPGLVRRDIPFIILANKQDSPDSIDEVKLRKILQVDRLKIMNELRYYVKNTTGRAGTGISEAFQMFEGKIWTLIDLITH